MGNRQTTLASSEARAFYDRFGKNQNTQSFYFDTDWWISQEVKKN